MVNATKYEVSDLDGEDPGGFVVVNLVAPYHNPYQILEDDRGGYFPTLRDARVACARWRTESGNDQIFVYALMGVGEAIDAHPDCFPLD